MYAGRSVPSLSWQMFLLDEKTAFFAPRQGRQPPASPYNDIHHAAATNGWFQISLNAGINVDLPLHLMGCSVLSLSWHSVDAPLDDISEIDPVHGHVITDAHQAGETMAERLPHQDRPHACAGKNARGLSSLFLTLVPSLSWQAIGFHLKWGYSAPSQRFAFGIRSNTATAMYLRIRSH